MISAFAAGGRGAAERNGTATAGSAGAGGGRYQACPCPFAGVDGIAGMGGSGPVELTPAASGVPVAGCDTVAVDAMACRMMGLDPLKIDYMKLCGASESRTAWRGIARVADRVETAIEPFAPIREFRQIRAERMRWRLE